MITWSLQKGKVLVFLMWNINKDISQYWQLLEFESFPQTVLLCGRSRFLRSCHKISIFAEWWILSFGENPWTGGQLLTNQKCKVKFQIAFIYRLWIKLSECCLEIIELFQRGCLLILVRNVEWEKKKEEETTPLVLKKIPAMILVPWVNISHFKACAAGTMTAFFAGPLPCLDK